MRYIKCPKKRRELRGKKQKQYKRRTGKPRSALSISRQRLLMKCKNFVAFVPCSREVLSEVSDKEPVIVLPTCDVADDVSSDLLCDMVEYSDLRPMQKPAYGDCLPTTTSYCMHGNADHQVEARARIAELAVHEDLYLDDNSLQKASATALQGVRHMPCSLICISPAQTHLPQRYVGCFKKKQYALSNQENTWAFGKSMPYRPYLEQE